MNLKAKNFKADLLQVLSKFSVIVSNIFQNGIIHSRYTPWVSAFLIQKVRHQSKAGGITLKRAANYRRANLTPIFRKIFHPIKLLLEASDL